MGRKSRSKRERREGRPEASSPPATAPFTKLAFCFAALVTAVHLLLWGWVDLLPLQRAIASLSGSLISFSGIPAKVADIEIFLPHAHWRVVSECTAISAIVVFSSLVLVFPANWNSRLIGLLVGIPLLMGANISRLFALAWVSHWLPGKAELFHDYVWQMVFLCLVVLMWLVWMNKVVGREKHPELSR